MLDAGELMFPVAAGPVRGPRYARLLVKARSAARRPARPRQAAPSLDVRPTSTNVARRAGLLASW